MTLLAPMPLGVVSVGSVASFSVIPLYMRARDFIICNVTSVFSADFDILRQRSEQREQSDACICYAES